MTRVRWIIGGLVGVSALVIAGKSLAAYVVGGSVVGVAAVVVLAVLLIVGFVSLARARRDVGRELAALAATPPGGALWAARRAHALELRGRNVVPDLDVLAEATAAEEVERGFAGKYLVATTILVGLVGTFGGLMETLAHLSPLLKGEGATDGPAGVLALLGGPLAGLHVTFGTSVVAILITLALALVQGDVALQQERLLARLQERTRHVLVPELWPAGEGAAERSARALEELKALVAGATMKTAQATAEATATKMADVARVELARLAQTVGAAMTGAASATSEAMTGAGAAMRAALADAATATREAMSEAGAALTATAAASAAALREDGDRTREAGAASVATLLAETRHQQDEAAAGLARAATALGEAAASLTASSEGAVTALAATAERSTAAFTAAVGTAVSGLSDLRAGVGGELGAAAQSITAASTELRGTAAELSPALAALTPQLAALAREVALLAARAENPEPMNAVLDELVRLGEDVERLAALAQPAPSPAASVEIDRDSKGAGA
jgi:hypothetical protein